jgi:hypothetical protein
MIDERLARLAKATVGVAPRAHFTDDVMAAVVAQGWWSSLPRVALRVVPAFAVAAVLAAAWAYHSTRELDDALTSSLGAVEIEW